MKKLLFLLLCFYSVLGTAQITTNKYFENGFQIEASYGTGFFHELQYLGNYLGDRYAMGWSKFNHCIRLQFSHKFYLGRSGNSQYGLNVIWSKTGVDLYQHGGLAGVHLGLGGIGFTHLTKFMEDSGLEFDISVHAASPWVRGLTTVGIEAQLILGINYQYKNLVVGLAAELFAGTATGGLGSKFWGGLAGLKVGYRFRKKD